MQAAGTMKQTMAGPAAAQPPAASRASAFADRWLYAAILLAAVLIRAPVAGDLNYHIDESFYLLVGERMRDGLLPYVDIWDRKPFGLFLLYWLIAALGKGSMIAVHLAAGICAVATAMLIAAVARRWVAPLPAGLAAIAYLAGLEALVGGGGQSPVFYNLPMVVMAALTLKAGDACDLVRFRKLATAAVLCGGAALTIKQTSLPECLFLGAALALHARHLTPSIAAWACEVALLACLGALPSLACLGFFAVIGQGGNYLFATLLSSFGRAPMAGTERLALALYLAPRILPLAVMTLAGVTLLLRDPTRSPGTGVLVGWIAAGIAGFLMVPNFYDHYALPLLPSLCVGAAPLFARRPLGPVYALLVIGISLVFTSWPALDRTRASNAAMQAAARAITAHGGGTSLYVFDGPVHLYTLTGAPLPTRWAFPEHLSTAEERDATGVDAIAELARILRTRPAVIVAADAPGARHPHPTAWRLLQVTLAREYKPVKEVAMPEFGGVRTIRIFARR
jgi:hypothetical protein